MINFKNVLAAAEILGVQNLEIFDVDISKKQTCLVFEDNDIIVSLNLGKMSQSRYLWSNIKFKKYNNVEKDSYIQIKIDSNKTLSENLSGVNTIKNIVESCLNTCNISGLEEVNFIENGYSLEISKTSNKYVTITEHVNAVVFNKRFSSLETLFNYINYRKNFHSKINIRFNVPSSEVENIERNIKTLDHNIGILFEDMINSILSYRSTRLLNTSQIEFTNIKKVHSCVTFDISFVSKLDKEYTLKCTYNSIGGMQTKLPSLELNSHNIDGMHTLLFILNQIEHNYSGNFLSYVDLVIQHKKFQSKINSVNSLHKSTQMDSDEICSKISDALKNARGRESMLSNKVPITGFGAYKRYIQLDGVMKNRKRCTLLVLSEHKNNIFEEYRISVEKNRIKDDCISFLEQYFK